MTMYRLGFSGSKRAIIFHKVCRSPPWDTFARVPTRPGRRYLKSAQIVQYAQRYAVQASVSEQENASRIKTSGAALIEIGADVSTQVKLKPGMDPGTDLDTYLLLCPEFVCDIGLPLGAVLTRDTESSVVITLPRMNFFDVWLQPIANAGVSAGAGMVDIASNRAVLNGSTHVERLNLQERYDCSAKIVWSSAGPDTLACEGKLVVNVDLPPPFSMMPKFVVTAGGNLTIQTMMGALSQEFTKSLARDYEQWSTDPALRAQREARYWAVTHPSETQAPEPQAPPEAASSTNTPTAGLAPNEETRTLDVGADQVVKPDAGVDMQGRTRMDPAEDGTFPAGASGSAVLTSETNAPLVPSVAPSIVDARTESARNPADQKPQDEPKDDMKPTDEQSQKSQAEPLQITILNDGISSAENEDTANIQRLMEEEAAKDSAAEAEALRAMAVQAESAQMEAAIAAAKAASQAGLDGTVATAAGTEIAGAMAVQAEAGIAAARLAAAAEATTLKRDAKKARAKALAAAEAEAVKVGEVARAAEAARAARDAAVARKVQEEEAARALAEAEAKIKAEEEEDAKGLAEAEAKEKAEEEEAAKGLAEAEAKIKAEEEEAARGLTEAEAKTKAEEEDAKGLAEAEAKKKAEEEVAAKGLAESEAKKKAEEEEAARGLAEAEAKKTAEEEEALAEAARIAEEKAMQTLAETKAARSFALESTKVLVQNEPMKEMGKEELANVEAARETDEDADDGEAQGRRTPEGNEADALVESENMQTVVAESAKVLTATEMQVLGSELQPTSSFAQQATAAVWKEAEEQTAQRVANSKASLEGEPATPIGDELLSSVSEPSSSGDMTVETLLQVLRNSGDHTDEEIYEAHRQLKQVVENNLE